MRLTLRQLAGETLKWFADPDSVKWGAVLEALNNSQEELQVKLSEAFNEKLERIDYIDLVADKDLYPLPDQVSDITMMERLDISGDTTTPGRAYPVVRIQSKRADGSGTQVFTGGGLATTPFSRNAPFSYVLMPERQFRLMEKPTRDFAKGLRITFNPRVTPLRVLDDVPALPEEIHECLVPLAVNRLAGSPGASLAQQQVFIAYAARLDKMFLSWCYPSDRERAPDIEEEFGIYEEVF